MEYLQLSLEEYEKSKKEIMQELGGVVKSFVRIGWQLTRIDRSGAYKNDGYSSIADFAKNEYGMNASGVSRFMTVYEKYSVDGDSPELKEQYREFKFAQLVELVQIPEEDHEMFTPEAKRESIREFKDFQKENESSPDSLLNWMKEPEDNVGKAILEFFRSSREITNRLFGSLAYKNWDLKQMAEIINPSGNAHFRYKTVFIMMYDFNTGLKVNEFGKMPQTMAWEEFFSKAEEIFKDRKDGGSTWEMCFGDQIPGQDNIENHPEYMPAPENSENPEKRGTSPSETDSEDQKKQPEAATETDTQSAPETVTGKVESDPAAAVEPVPDEINGHQIIGFAPAQKKDAYEQEQARIDRETKKKLQEMEDAEKMAHLPSDEGPKVHQIRLAATYYDDVVSGRKTFELRKNDRDYRTGHALELMEFHDGKYTGRVIHADIIYMLEDYTGLEEGYCILGILVRDYN